MSEAIVIDEALNRAQPRGSFTFLICHYFAPIRAYASARPGALLLGK